MAKLILTNVRMFAGGLDATTVSNQVELSSECEVKDVTNYGSAGWKENIGGLFSSELKAQGFWEAGDTTKVDDRLAADMAAVKAVTVCPNAAAVADIAYIVQALQGNYSLGGQVGDVAPWKADYTGSYPLARGVVAHPPGTARTASGTGTSVNLGAVTAGQRLYASMHVLSVAGTSTPTITGRIESDDNSGFTSATTRLTFTAATAVGGEVLRTDGTAITDTWWRAAWTISGTTPSFLFLSAFGIK